jgi:outer membrane protein assembly factor BamB
MDTGNMLWNYSTDGQITSSPAVENGRIYIGSQDSKLYCLDATDGDLIWEYKTNFMIESSPTVKDGKVFFGSSDGSLYCLNAVDGNYFWSYSTGNVIWSTPAVTDNRVYFGSLNGDFLCLDIINGNLIWDYETSSGIWSSPAISDGNAYFGSNDDFVYCLDADTGDYIWSYDTGGEVHSSPAVAYGNVYIGSTERGLFCLDADTGNLVWDYLLDGGIRSPPAIADDKVYFGTYPCCGNPAYVSCFDAYSGVEIWDYPTGGTEGMKASPSIAAGKVFFGTGRGIVMAFGEIQFLADANGPYFNHVNTSTQFIGSVYGGFPDYSWFWEFGDGHTSIEQNPTHTYNGDGNYVVTLTVTDDESNVAVDETYALIEMFPTNNPPDIPVIDGSTNGKPGEEYTYCIIATDPDDDDLYVLWNWGDGESTDWLGPFSSGDEICSSHIWTEKGTYIISVNLKDGHGEIVTASLEVSMPRNKILQSPLFEWFFERILNNYQILRYFLRI